MLIRRTALICLLFIMLMVIGGMHTNADADDPPYPVPHVLKSASELDYPPFAVVRPDGSADGFSVDLLKAVTETVGLKVDITVGPWNEIKQQLADGLLDVLPLVSYSPERDAVYDFTVPYLRMHGTIFVRKDNKSIRGKGDLKDKEIIVMRGDTAHEYTVRDHLSDKLILTDNFEEAMEMLSQGKHDAVIIQQLVGLQLIKKLGIENVVSTDSFKETSLKPTDKPLSGFEQKFCIAVKDGDSELLALLNEGLSIVIANGTYDALYDKWFGPILPPQPIPLFLIFKYLLFVLGPMLFILAVAGVWYLKREVARKTSILKMEINERQQIETALRESEEKLKGIFDTVDSGIILVSEKGEITFANRRMADMFGYDLEELIGSLYTKHTHESQLPEARQIMYQLMEGRIDTVNLERLYKRSDGSTFWGHLAGNRIYHPDGSFWSLVGVIHDISEQKKLARQLQQSQKMEAIGILAGGIAHNFNNILSAIMGFTELSLDEVEPGTSIAENLQEVFKASIRARDLVKQMLSFAGQSNEDIRPLRVDEIVLEVLQFIRSSIPATIEINQFIESDSLVMGEASQLHQVLINLCTNAAHAMQNSSGSIAVTLTDVMFEESFTAVNKDLAPGNYVKLSVSDTGAGIAPDILGSIFDPYFTTKGPDKGTGMGLAMVHGIIDIYGGGITVDTQIGKGTTFTIYLPVIGNISQTASELAAEISERGGNILFVDDDPAIAKMQQQRLERMGYTVKAFTDGQEALEIFRSSPDSFDMVITDMAMPKMTGDRLAFEIKKIRSNIPVILCTGFSDSITLRAGADFQIDGFLMKPVDKAQLSQAIRKVLGAS